MKRFALIYLVTLLILVFPATSTANSKLNNGPSAEGSFEMSIENVLTIHIDFNVRQEDGKIVGEMTYREPTRAANASVRTGEPEPDDSASGFYLKAAFDCFHVKGRKAVMSGMVNEASAASYVGRRVLLVVQEGESKTNREGARFAWGVYKQTVAGWLPSDLEQPDEQGAPSAWFARDLERDDDEGVPSEKNEVIGCQSFPLSALSFVAVKQGKVKIQL